MKRLLTCLVCLSVGVTFLSLAAEASAQVTLKKKKIDEAALEKRAKEQADKAAKLADPKAERVRLYVEGAYCSGCAEVLDTALDDGGLKLASKVPVNKGRGYVIILALMKHDGDLGTLAKAVNEAQTPHRERSQPGLLLELCASLDEASAKQALAALEKVEGVDAAGSIANVERGTLGVRLDGKSKTSVNKITVALTKAGIETEVIKEPAPQPAAEPAEK